MRSTSSSTAAWMISRIGSPWRTCTPTRKPCSPPIDAAFSETYIRSGSPISVFRLWRRSLRRAATALERGSARCAEHTEHAEGQ
jgi:hypothetical protein